MGRVGRAAVVLVLAVLAASCRWVDPYPEYRDVNLLEDRGMSAVDFQVSSGTGGDATGYIVYDATLTPAEYGSTSGLPDGEEDSIHRLEIPNLLPNGDFETTGDNAVPAGWQEKAGVAFRGSVGASGDIEGQSIVFEVGPGTGDRFAIYDLDVLSDGFVDNATYFFQADFIRETGETDIVFDYGNGSEASNESYLNPPGEAWVSEGPDTTPTLETIPTVGVMHLDIATLFHSSTWADNYFYVGPAEGSRVSAGVLDNLRIGRSDPAARVSLSLGPAGEGQLDLPKGTYTFSVYVKAEIDDQVTPSANGLNRFRSDQICLGSNGDSTCISRTEGGWTSGSWTMISTEIELDHPATDEDPLVLWVSVFLQGYEAVGSILVAAPSLTLGGLDSE
jgi:hypothetical protein